MASLMTRVRKLLADRFDGARIKLERRRNGDRIDGKVVWEGFEDQEQIDRQIALRGTLRENLDPDDLAKVAFVMALTPVEDESLAVID